MYAYIVFAKKLCEYKTLVLQINIVVDAKMILDDNKKYYINIQVCRCCTTTNYFQSMLVTWMSLDVVQSGSICS